MMPELDVVTEPRLSHLRLHGRDPMSYLTGKTVAERFHYEYSDVELGEVADRARDLATVSDEVHIVFNNNWFAAPMISGMQRKHSFRVWETVVG